MVTHEPDIARYCRAHGRHARRPDRDVTNRRAAPGRERGVEEVSTKLQQTVGPNSPMMHSRHLQNRRARAAPQQAAHRCSPCSASSSASARSSPWSASATAPKRRWRRRSPASARTSSWSFPATSAAAVSACGWGSAGTLTRGRRRDPARESPGSPAVSPEVRSYGANRRGQSKLDSPGLGESADYLDIRPGPWPTAPIFTEQDVRNANKVALIGQTTARRSLRRRRSGRPDRPHQERALHHCRRARRQRAAAHGQRPGRRGDRSLHAAR